MNKILAYCRPGYESDTANELQGISTELNLFGYPMFKPGDGFVEFHFYQADHAQQFCRKVAVRDTIFPRQIIWLVGECIDMDKADRLTPILDLVDDAELADIGSFGAVWVEYADTDAGKELAKFCRKFNVPLRQALRGKKLLTKQEQEQSNRIHVFFTEFDRCSLGVSFKNQSANHINGICRLKFPPKAPSRSTLKLEEAIREMMTPEQQAQVFREGARAVDLGACPGGWTYQLVAREMSVEAIDNGKIDDELMATGLVEHFAADGFTYKPQFGRVALLVCDMIEQPDRVAELMAKWMVKGWAEHAIFNLKLPMKKRYETVTEALTMISGMLAKAGIHYHAETRHLYHDRDEVTVVIIRKE